LDIPIRSEDSGLKSNKIYYVLVPFGGQAPKFLDRDYKIEHVAKFCGDRPRDVENLELKKRRKTVVKHKAFWTIVPGGLITLTIISNSRAITSQIITKTRAVGIVAYILAHGMASKFD